MTAKLFLMRHLQSQWNLENKFTGWTDVPLSKEGKESAKAISKKLANAKIDAVYTSPLKRNRDTVSLVLKNIGKENLPIFESKALDERNYGELTGLDKEEMMEKYGEQKVRQWRRSFDVAPPGGESLKDVLNRVEPYYKNFIEKDLRAGKNVLVVASHNSLRALVKHIKEISDKDIVSFEIPPGAILEYGFDGKSYF